MRSNFFKEIEFGKLVKSPFNKGAIIRKDFPGFREDYLVIFSLIRRFQPLNIMEIGTSTGMGTNVLCKAFQVTRFWGNKLIVKSIDVPPGTDPNIIYPDHEDGHPNKTGRYCKRPYTQLFGDSTAFDFSPYYPIESWFIDGKHNYEYATKDTEQALKSNPKLLMWHDKQIAGVAEAIREVMGSKKNYAVFQVPETRIAFAVLTTMTGQLNSQ